MATDHPFDVLEYRDGVFRAARVRAIREVPLRMVVNGRELVRLMFTGAHPRFLAAGYLLSCGLIESARDIATLDVEEGPDALEARVALRNSQPRAHALSVTSGLGRVLAGQGQRLRTQLPLAKGWVDPAAVVRLAAELHARSDLYRLTRGCHNASLCSAGEMLLFRSDIGRHNAIDTLAGQCLLEGLPTGDKMVVSTGRVASEIVHKAVRAGIPVLASTAAATALAVESAREHGLTLIGNVDAGGFRVYSDPGRLAG
ncbi:formate dehydrogenase accessory sulfurtransferase FdhD [Fundidesulfovibrio agrisoli]|uniref:formate dehydrogenase accessory sulfurtransferase FdhD n=1 Tax=Fundidesulfovibrio agrisoli TaxID=2922717 RepID=UPI001FAC81BC|nr:formate dehydrogenase accessory sulfurtransferase FdhD [Fundidesulfovibrio agrisoli]